MILRSTNICPTKAAGITIELCLLLLGVFATPLLHAQLNTTQAIETGRAAMLYDDYETGIHYFSRAIEAKPYLSDAYYYRGFAQFHLGNYISAEDDLSRAIMFNPFHIEYYQLRGLCRIHNEKYVGAADDYTEVLKERPEDQNAHFNRALCFYELREFPRANTDLDYIIGHWPRFARAYVVKAQTCLEMRDTLQSIFWLDSLLSISKGEPTAWSIKGRYALEKGNYSYADSCFTQALKYDAANVQHYLCRAQARIAQGHYAEAINDYDRILFIEPENKTANFNKNLINDSRSKKNPKLLANLKQAENFDFHKNYMEEFKGKVQNHNNEHVFLPPYRVRDNHLFVDGGRFPIYSSDEDYLQTINSADTENHISTITALFKLRQYVADSPNDAILLYNLGCLEVEGGTIEEAEKAFSQAIASDPLLAEAYYNKAVTLLLQGKTDAAKPLLAKAGEMGIVKAFRLLNQITKP